MGVIETVSNLALSKNTDSYGRPWFVIFKKLADGNNTDIAYVTKNDFGEPCTKSVGSNLQNYIITYEEYKSFIRLVDRAFDEIA